VSEDDFVLDGLFRGKRLHTFAPPEATTVAAGAEVEREETRSGLPERVDVGSTHEDVAVHKRVRGRIRDPGAPEPPPKHA
jgi:hypothetical protein